jgi:protein-L-isoaspartate O-methyltransferase
MSDMTATYDPADNKLRLYSSERLSATLYSRVKSAGFKWAPQQKLFVAPMWTPDREDLLLDLCDEIGDEDTSLVERAEERSDRFRDYSRERATEANQAHDVVESITGGIPLGQPILVGHHSERRARKDAERIENGMRKAIRLWETSEYWKDRAKGAIAHAKYKEIPAVRHRRIKGLESDRRSHQRSKDGAVKCMETWSKVTTREEALALANIEHAYFHVGGCTLPNGETDWSAWSAIRDDKITFEEVQRQRSESMPRIIEREDRWLQHIDNRLEYERAMLSESGGIATDKFDLKVGGQILTRGVWLTILKINKSNGAITSVSTNNTSWPRIVEVENIKDYRAPTEEVAEKAKAANKLPPMCNYPGEAFTHITQEKWDGMYKDHKGSRVIEATAAAGRHRVRSWYRYPNSSLIYITDAKRKDPPPANGEAQPKPPLPAVEHDLPTLEREAARRKEYQQEQATREASPFELMKQSLEQGVQTVVAPQLFETPAEIADQVVALADINHNHRILEPSAGTGNLVRAIMAVDNCARVTAIEISPGLAEQLRGRFGRGNYNCDISCKDFLECLPEVLGTFDRIVMNPPFVNGSDIKHIEYAMKFLKPGGRLVAICANGPRQQKHLQPIATAWIDLPAGSFKEQGTNVNAAIVVIEAPVQETTGNPGDDPAYDSASGEYLEEMQRTTR